MVYRVMLDMLYVQSSNLKCTYTTVKDLKEFALVTGLIVLNLFYIVSSEIIRKYVLLEFGLGLKLEFLKLNLV